MSKTYKGYELIKAIADGEIKEGSRFSIYHGKMKAIYVGKTLCYENSNKEIGNSVIINQLFELIEDEIDIDSIEELYERDKDYIRRDVYEIIKNNREAIIELQRAIKQLNKEIKELKEK